MEYKINENGQVTIPKKLRDALDIKSNSMINITNIGNSIIISKVEGINNLVHIINKINDFQVVINNIESRINEHSQLLCSHDSKIEQLTINNFNTNKQDTVSTINNE